MKIFFVPVNILLWTIFFTTSVVLFMGAFLIWLVTLPFDPNRKVLQKFSCFWASIYVWANPFWSAKIYGRENYDPKKAYVIVANHQSLIDILILFRTFLHFKWVSKASMFKAPLLGWNMKLNGYVSIERGDPNSREKCMAHCRQWIQKGSSMLFFPEGTRSHDGHLKSFKIGAFRLALETGAEILPIIIRGSRNAVPKHSIMLTRKTKMSVEILPSISLKDFDARNLPEEAGRLADHVHQIFKTALDQPIGTVRVA